MRKQDQSSSATAPEGAVTTQRVLDALASVLSSQTFAGSDRLAGFLEYVVREELAGRGDLIRGKSIAMDLYGYSPQDIERHEAVVRVDAGRLRRKLDAYYETDGANDGTRFQLPKGQFKPVFLMTDTVNGHAPETQVSSSKSSWVTRGVALTAVLVVATALYTLSRQEVAQFASGTSEPERVDAQRKALFDTSPERLQAINLAQQGRGLIFPATDPRRLNAAKLIFESVIQLDPTYSGGYAGLSQVSGLMAFIIPDAAGADAWLAASEENAGKALALQPDSSWAISARAWAEFSVGNYSAALSWSRRARELAPDDPHILEFDTLISLYCGEFEDVLQVTSRMADTTQSDLPFVFQNARSAAFFHSGDYKRSIKGFEDAIAAGAPLGPITVAYLMAAHHFSGDDRRARNLAGKYQNTWPMQRVDLISNKLFRDPMHAAKLYDGMRGAGWAPDG